MTPLDALMSAADEATSDTEGRLNEQWANRVIELLASLDFAIFEIDAEGRPL